MFLKKIIYVIFFVYSKALNASSLFELHSNQSKVMISISAIWEGKDLKKENLKAMTKFRKNFSHIPLIQFLNPAYFTKDDSSYKLIRKKINNVISQDDIIGLHIHPWKSLIENSNVAFRQTPSYWGRHINLLNSMKDFGHDVPLSVYSQDEIYRIIKHSLNLLEIFVIYPMTLKTFGNQYWT